MKPRSLLVSLAVSIAAIACGPKPAPTTGPGPGSNTATAGSDTEVPASTGPALPLWTAVRHGTLPNGLDYYILPHHKPEKRAHLWLAVNAGAVQEDDNQRGLAHFVEHMCFNGTKRFPKQDIVNFIESIGIKFGADLNAYTSFDETVYQLTVPTDDPAKVAKGFDIVRDWAGDVTFDPKEVDKERGVVLEEWRLGRGFQQRLLDKLITVVFGDSKYAKRIPIGLPEIIKNAPRDRLVKFYKDWYRPDLMAVIAVGDFADTAAIEKQIVAKFSDLKNPANERPHQRAGTPPASGTRIAIETDRELPLSLVGVGNLVPHRPDASEADFRRSLTEQLYQHMLNERLQTISRQPDAPFAMAGVIIQNITREVDAFARFAVVKNDDSEAALRAMFSEVVRVERHGFAQSELDRARAVLLRNFEQSAKEAETRDSKEFTAELVRHFLNHEFVVGSKRELELARELLPKITLPELDKLAASFGGAENRVIVVAGPDGKPMPTEAKIKSIIDEVGRSKVEAWKDVPVATNLMEPPAWPGTVDKETKIPELGVTEWKLGNGVRVIVKPTDYERDEVRISADSPGGLAMADKKTYPSARFATAIVSASGIGELDADALGKSLAGKHVAVTPVINETSESIDAQGSAQDLETMLQLIHLDMTAPRRDDKAFGVWKTNLVEALKNQERSPDVQFAKQSQAELWRRHPYHLAPEPADVEKVDVDKALDFYRQRFADASDFTFVIVGAVDLDKLKPLVEAYIGSLPSKGKKEKERDIRARRVTGVIKKTWKLGQDQAKARVQVVFHGPARWTRDDERDMHILGQVLSIRLREVLREDMSGVYGVGAWGQLVRSPHQERVFQIVFGCAPGAVDKLVDAAHKEIAKIAKSGIDKTYLEKVKETYLRDRETGMRTNRFWSDWLSRAAYYGDDPKLVLDPKPVIARITSARVQAAARRFLPKRSTFEAVMLPAAAPAATKPGT